MIQAMLVDDHVMIREGIRQLLEFGNDIKIIAEANNGNECLTLLATLKPDIILLDLNMEQKNGIDTLKEIRTNKLPVKVLILTVHNEIEYLMKARELEADGYLLKDSSSEELRKAIFTIVNGSTYIQPKLVPYLNAKLVERDIDKEKIKSMTKREIEVLIKIAEGMFNKEIATVLNISERTVKNHIFNIFKKLEVSDRTQAAVFAIKNKLILL
jgi:two-component system, NarL family, response regulator DegU